MHYASVAFFRRAFLRLTPRRYAVMLTPDEAVRRDQKYHEQTGVITDTLLQRHVAGQLALAAPVAVHGYAHLLPLDVDGGGIAAITALMEVAAVHGFWTFGQYCPRPALPDEQQRGYVWVPFAREVDAERIQDLGELLITEAGAVAQRTEARAHAAVTRLPLARHTHTGRFGHLLVANDHFCIDDDPAGAHTRLQTHYRENSLSLMPPLPAAPEYIAKQQPTSSSSCGTGVTIARYNDEHNLVELLEHYGARRAGRRIMHCCGHTDTRRASLLLWEDPHGKLYCKCLSQHQSCPLAGRMRDAFGVYCAMEGIDATEALRDLNDQKRGRHAH